MELKIFDIIVKTGKSGGPAEGSGGISVEVTADYSGINLYWIKSKIKTGFVRGTELCFHSKRI